MDSNNCHIRPTPLQAAIYRRIFRCLYDRFLDCPLSFARLLENPTYAAIADCKFLTRMGRFIPSGNARWSRETVRSMHSLRAKGCQPMRRPFVNRQRAGRAYLVYSPPGRGKTAGCLCPLRQTGRQLELHERGCTGKRVAGTFCERAQR